jgi:uncharacterized membrane protein (UPF0127 family)
MEFFFKGKLFSINVRKVAHFSFGLMFRTKRTENILFEFSKPSDISLTSIFVFFPFAVLWLDDKNKVVDLRIVKPFELTIQSKKKFHKIVEIPLNKSNIGVLKELFPSVKRKV